jgi:hypothetical protein
LLNAPVLFIILMHTYSISKLMKSATKSRNLELK